MIAERDTTRTVTSTLGAAGAEDVKMGISQEGLAYVMDSLANLYEHTFRAVVREYSTNARDAHIEAGVTRPIEVSLPSMLSPFLRIRDYGVGLTRDDIRAIYSQYGASTKRGTNSQTGMLGYGCKSAFSVSDQFTVVSVKDGFRIQVSIERDEDGVGVMRIVSEEMTDDPNGTEVIIPIPAQNTVEQEARFFFSVWEPGTVLVNGQEPKRIQGLKLTDDLMVIEGKTSYVVMGNVPYPTTEIDHGLPRSWSINEKSIMAFVPIGAVNFTPSREGLKPTKQTRETLEKINAKVKRELQGAIQREVDRAPTHRDALRVFAKWSQDLGQSRKSWDYIYKGECLPASFQPATQWMVNGSNGDVQQTRMLVTDNSTYKLSKAERYDALPWGQFGGSMILYGYTLRGVTATQKKKMRQYVQDKGYRNVNRFVLVAAKPPLSDSRWFDPNMIVPWDDVNAIKLPSQASRAGKAGWGRLAGSYDLMEGASDGHVMPRYEVPGKDIDQSKPIYYVHGNLTALGRYAPLLAEYHAGTGCYMVALGGNRIAKFCRDVPKAKRVSDGVKDAWKSISSKITEEEKLAMHIHDTGSAVDLKKLDADRIDDPAVKEAIRLAKLDVKDWMRKRQKYDYLLDSPTIDKVVWSDPLDQYPLFQDFYSGYSRNNTKFGDDMYLYINAKYASITNKGA